MAYSTLGFSPIWHVMIVGENFSATRKIYYSQSFRVLIEWSTIWALAL